MHGNAPLTPEGRLRLCRRIEEGWPVAHAASSMGISRDRAYVWWRRYQAEGITGLEDRSSRPHHSPNQLKRRLERRVVSLRRNRGLGPARIAGIVGLHPSTTHRVLVRHGLNRLDHLDRLTREPIRRFEMSRPGELVHVDIKKLGRIPKGRRMAGPRPVQRAPRRASQGRLCLYPHGHRRLQPVGLFRGVG
jgi:transposase-like protein